MVTYKTGNCFEIFFFSIFVGNLEFSWFSLSFAYCFAVIACINSIVVAIFIEKIPLILESSENNFDRQVFDIQNIIVIAPILSIPLTFWFDTRRFVEFVQKWSKFEVRRMQASKSRRTCR